MRQSIWDDIKMRIIHSNNSLIHLIAINVAAFLVTSIPIGLSFLFFQSASENPVYGFVSNWLYLPGQLLDFATRPWTLITHFFLHSSFSFYHIFFNMMVFWMFGRIYHNLMGNARTVQLFVLAGMAGGLAFILANPIFPTLADHKPLVGASGAVMGFVVAATALSPLMTVRLMFFGEIKLWMIAATLVIMDIIFIAGNTGGRIAHLAGGFTGYLFVTQLRKGNDFGAWISKALLVIQTFFKPKPKSKFKVHSNPKTSNTSRGSSNQSSSFTNAVSQEEIDAILDKIAKSGYDSLSKREKDILFKVSDKN
ncbi:MAG: rhomboid family intramembrane serine protease [Bacteroidia bacterium]